MNGSADRGRGDAPGSRTHRWRLRIVGIGFVLLAAVYVGRGVHLQVVEQEKWSQKVQEQSARQVELPAERGGIFDRDGRPLAVSDQVYRGYLAPREVRDQERAVTAIRRVLGLSSREVSKLRRAESGWVALPRRLSASERDRLEAAVRQGVYFEHVPSRNHPEGGLASPVVGNVGADGRGQSGLELALDSLLVGEPGRAMSRRDARGELYPLPDGKIASARPGHDVHLTLDGELQTIAQNALDDALKETGASGGDILIMDPETGDLLAVASRRSGEPGGLPAFTSPYEPGSTAKPFLLSALLAEERVSLDDSVYAEDGVYRTEHRTIRDVHPMDTITVRGVIRESSNIGAAKLAEKLEPGVQYSYLRDFGFGTPTGITFPSESGGRLRRPEEWSALSQASLAMGYEISVTSLQLATAYSALANDGVLMRPHLVEEVRNASGEVVYRREPASVRRVVSEEVASHLRTVLRSVVEEGTATRASMTSLPLAGKTGTARLASSGGYRDRRYAASFVGFAPAKDPKLLVLTKLEDPQGDYYGGLTAAPVSRMTLQAALSSRGTVIPGDSWSGESLHRVEWGGPPSRAGRGTPSAGDSGPYVLAVGGEQPDRWSGGDEGQTAVLPDLSGMTVRGAVARLHELGLQVELRSGGEVRSQRPAPGTRMAPGDTVVLH